jgi:tripartite-type tricarboxylate transporter receptor subunit TctC
MSGRTFGAILFAITGLALVAPAHAREQGFPAKPVRMIVPFPPGGATDIVGRLLAGKMQEIWKQPVIVENKPGAGTVLATDFVAKSPPDGYTLGFVITAHVINPSLRSNLPYDTMKDLAGITQVSRQHMVIAANPSFEANSIADLIAAAKKTPGKIAYATPGEGTAMHLTIERLKSAAAIDLVHVPYKGGAPAQQDVLGGRVPLLVDVHYATEPLIKSGKLKALALLSPQRVKTLPELPVIAETVPGVSSLSIVGLVAPRATPRELVRRISTDVAKALRSADLNARMTEVGMEPVGSTPEQFDAFIRSEIERWSAMVKTSGAKIE